MTPPGHKSALATLDVHTRLVTVAPLPAANPADISASILLEAHIYASAREVWNAMSRPQNLSQWFSNVSGEIRRGGTYYVGNTSWGNILDAVPERRFVATWNFDDRTSQLGVDLTPPFEEELEGIATLVSIAHSSHLTQHDWESYGVLAVGSAWDAMAYKLGRFLEDPESTTIQSELAEWERSEDALEFTLESIRRWTDATIAYGVDRDQARAMQRNTIALMTATMQGNRAASAPYGAGVSAPKHKPNAAES